MLRHILSLVGLVYGDLPIHATIDQVAGKWRFELVPMSQDGFYSAKESLPASAVASCGSSIPNKNTDNLDDLIQNNYLGWLLEQRRQITGSDAFVPIPIELTLSADRVGDKIHPGWKNLAVYDKNDDVKGSWTMVYDEAFEVRIPGSALTLTGLIKYRLNPEKNGTCTPRDDATEGRDGSTNCYITEPRETLLGWFEESSEELNTQVMGCFYGRKIEDIDPPMMSLTEKIDPVLPLPKNFSWGDPIMSPEKMTKNDRLILNQGGCGSCYALASAYVLQKRSEIAMASELPESGISSKEVVNCSFYGQGCQGGYPYLVGKWAKQFGLLSGRCGSEKGESCPFGTFNVGGSSNASSHGAIKFMSNGSAHKKFLTRSKCTDSENRLFARDYGYVGGCFECGNEEAMLAEIMAGPIIAAIDAPQSLLMYDGGVFTIEARDHARKSTEFEEDSGLNGWEYTNHAVVLVGFGETVDGEKFWIARNSWGSEWGKGRPPEKQRFLAGGYFLVERGTNLGGLENQAVFLIPDVTRGILGKS